MAGGQNRDRKVRIGRDGRIYVGDEGGNGGSTPQGTGGGSGGGVPSVGGNASPSGTESSDGGGNGCLVLVVILIGALLCYFLFGPGSSKPKDDDSTVEPHYSQETAMSTESNSETPRVSGNTDDDPYQGGDGDTLGETSGETGSYESGRTDVGSQEQSGRQQGEQPSATAGTRRDPGVGQRFYGDDEGYVLQGTIRVHQCDPDVEVVSIVLDAPLQYSSSTLHEVELMSIHGSRSELHYITRYGTLEVDGVDEDVMGRWEETLSASDGATVGVACHGFVTGTQETSLHGVDAIASNMLLLEGPYPTG